MKILNFLSRVFQKVWEDDQKKVEVTLEHPAWFHINDNYDDDDNKDDNDNKDDDDNNGDNDDNDDNADEKKRKTGRSGLVSLPCSAALGFLALIINHHDDDDDVNGAADDDDANGVCDDSGYESEGTETR